MDVKQIFDTAIDAMRGVTRATRYNDYIAHVCAVALARPDPEHIIKSAGPVQHDLHPQGGYLVSSTKVVLVEDRNGVKYRVTVEEMP